jgi:ssDNA-binding Zn-finger/Zn-ribbon topoisomerase 1
MTFCPDCGKNMVGIFAEKGICVRCLSYEHMKVNARQSSSLNYDTIISVKIDWETLSILRQIAKRDKVSVSHHIRIAIDKYLEEHDDTGRN